MQFGLSNDDRSNVTVMDDINKAIKSAARTITRTKLSDKIRSENVLHKAKLKCLTESVASTVAVTVWKSKMTMNSLGQCLFQERKIGRSTRSENSQKIRPPVPGYLNMATNFMARVWNDITELHSATTLSAARVISKNWAKRIPR